MHEIDLLYIILLIADTHINELYTIQLRLATPVIGPFSSISKSAVCSFLISDIKKGIK